MRSKAPRHFLSRAYIFLLMCGFGKRNSWVGTEAHFKDSQVAELTFPPCPYDEDKRSFCFIFLSLHYFRKPQELRLRMLHCVSHSRFLCTQVHLPNRYLDKH